MKTKYILLVGAITASIMSSVFAEEDAPVSCPSASAIIAATYAGPFSIDGIVIKGVYDYSMGQGSLVVLPPSASGTPSRAQSRIYLNQTTASWTPSVVRGGICTYKPGGTAAFRHINSGVYIVWLNASMPSSKVFQGKSAELMMLNR